MVPEYANTDCKIFALFTANYPKYTFEGFTLNDIIFKESNKKKTRVMSYVLEKNQLLDIKELIFLLEL